MLDKNLTIDGDSQSFENPRKHNNSVTAPNSQVPLEYDTLQCQQNTTTHMTRQKVPPPGKDYICFQTYRKNA